MPACTVGLIRPLHRALQLGALLGLAACAGLPSPPPGASAPAADARPAPARPPAPAVSAAVPAPSPATDGLSSPPQSGSAPGAAPATGVLPEPPADTLAAGEPMREIGRGGASWYGKRFHKRRTASGERYDMHTFTAAHRTLPFGTVVRVRSLVNGREVDVRINDRGPFTRTRIIDVSRAAADELGMRGLGVKEVVLMLPQ
ncbi:MAG: septal ring lytic transglycosylase RlpA family protein, partial [Comamonadaceae bacterium]